jgi:hypothetical protein
MLFIPATAPPAVVKAIHSGDLLALKQLLTEHPELPRSSNRLFRTGTARIRSQAAVIGRWAAIG